MTLRRRRVLVMALVVLICVAVYVVVFSVVPNDANRQWWSLGATVASVVLFILAVGLYERLEKRARLRGRTAREKPGSGASKPPEGFAPWTAPE